MKRDGRGQGTQRSEGLTAEYAKYAEPEFATESWRDRIMGKLRLTGGRRGNGGGNGHEEARKSTKKGGGRVRRRRISAVAWLWRDKSAREGRDGGESEFGARVCGDPAAWAGWNSPPALLFLKQLPGRAEHSRGLIELCRMHRNRTRAGRARGQRTED